MKYEKTIAVSIFLLGILLVLLIFVNRIDNVRFYDDKTYTTSKDLEINFKNISNFSEVVIRVKSDKEDSKFAVDMYNYKNESWETYYDGYLRESYSVMDIAVFDSERYIEDSKVKLKFDLNESDKYDFDWITLLNN